MNTDASIGQRVEVVEPADQGGGAVRRRVDAGRPRLGAAGRRRRTTRSSTTDGALNAASYRQWLDELAVAYVAVPDTKLDFASVDEAKLIAGGLPYLHEVWHNADWKLYQVIDSAPLARHAQVHLGGRATSCGSGSTSAGAGADPDPLVGPPRGPRRHPAGVRRRARPRLPVAERRQWTVLHAPRGRRLRAHLRLRRDPRRASSAVATCRQPGD